MLRSYLRTALRSIGRDSLYSALNILGLAVGLAVFFLILSWIRFELSYDTFHSKADRIVRVVKEDADNFYLGTNQFAVTPVPLEQALLDEVPGVEASTQINDVEALLKVGETAVVTEGLTATASFLDVFDFPLLQGDPSTALARPGSVLLTPDLARRLFGEEDPVGRTVDYEYFSDRFTLEVAGLVEPPPANSHFGFSFVISADTDPDRAQYADNWGSNSLYTYAVLRPDADFGTFAAQVAGLADRHLQDNKWYDPENPTTLVAQRLTDIHLNSRANFELEANGDMAQVRWGFLLALLIVLIPCTNYMNLATARAATRQREVGVRKAIGADRRQLVVQFLGESILVAALSAIVAAVIVAAIRPVFNELVLRDIPQSFLLDARAVALALIAILGVGMVSGSYPAFVLARSRASSILRGNSVLASHRSRLRDVLVVAQFAVGIGLIFSTLVVHGQIRFTASADTGMDRGQVLTLRMRDPAMRSKWDALRSEIALQPGVTAVTGASYLPTNVGTSNGLDEWEGNDDGREMQVYMTDVDYGFTEMLGLEIVHGRSFSREFAVDEESGILINETAAAGFGWDDPIGKHVFFGDTPSEVVGVVRDFNFHSFRQAIAPLVMSLAPGRVSYVLVKTDGRDLPATVAAIGEVWNRFTTGFPYDYQFLDDAFNRHFEPDRRLAELLDAFSAIALVIACLGLFGLAAFIAQQRTKEIGVRKVLGAGSTDIVLLLTRDFTLLVLIAVVVGCPVGYLLMDRWLDGFAYRISPGLGTVLLAACLAVTVGWGTIAWQSLRAARLDPARSLRYE